MQKLTYMDYKWVKETVWHCLLDSGIDTLPVKLSKIAKAFNIKLLSNSVAQTLQNWQSGRNYIDPSGQRYIVYRDSDQPGRCRFTIAHELGHIFLDHDYLITNDYDEHGEGESPAEERLANKFAAQLLAPAVVLWGMNLRTPEQIMRFCDLTEEAAGYRAKEMAGYYEKNRFLTSPLERQVFEQFRPYIEML